ncbi:HNH endonuclease signature motif containing protein [Citricoccus zhacaiensis]
MAIGVVERKLLWGRANDECAYPDCSQELTVNLDDPESRVLGNAGAVIGEEAHIRSGSVDGPRYEAKFPRDEIDTYRNLILLCPTHHTLVDKDCGRGYSIEDLEQMRVHHEAAMRATRSTADETSRRISERVAASVKVWEDKMLLEDWQSLTFGLNYTVPLLRDKFRSAMLETSEWLLAKDWPAEFPAVREAFGRFREALNAITTHVLETFDRDGDQRWELEREYKRIGWDPELYEELAAKFQLECAITWCLTIELTKAGNLVVRAVRKEIEPFYRFDEGVLLARDGDGIITMQIVRLEYEDHEWGEKLPAIDLKQWRAIIQAEAEERRARPDAISPYEMVSIIKRQTSREARAE